MEKLPFFRYYCNIFDAERIPRNIQNNQQDRKWISGVDKLFVVTRLPTPPRSIDDDGDDIEAIRTSFCHWWCDVMAHLRLYTLCCQRVQPFLCVLASWKRISAGHSAPQHRRLFYLSLRLFPPRFFQETHSTLTSPSPNGCFTFPSHQRHI